MGLPQDKWIGRSLRRREDARLLRGEGRFVGDVRLPGMLHMVVARSPFAHARLVSIETRAAAQARGVVAVITAADLDGLAGPMPIGPVEGAWLAPAPIPLLASDRVRFVGEPVAAVVADSHAAATDALDLLGVEYEPLRALVEPQEALRGDALLHDTVEGNLLLRWSRESGDVAGAFASAAHVVRGEFRIPRLIAAPIEPRGAVASYDAGSDYLSVWCSAQDPHRPLAHLGRVLGRPDDRTRIVVPDVGGAFGSKGALAPEAAVAAAAAMRLGHPVRWIEDRRENLMASYQGRGLHIEMEMALDPDGRMLAIRADVVADLGAYLYPTTAVMPVTTSMLLTGVYRIPAASVRLRGVATNKVPTGPYRGAGRPEAAYAIERMVDLAARDLGIDPIEMRRRNLIAPDRFPHKTPLGFVYDSGDYAPALERACDLIGYDAWQERSRKAAEDGRFVGVGVALYVERAGTQLWESASVTVNPDCRVVVRTGSCAHGQGHQTSFAQVAADALGVDPDDVVVLQGDSAIVPRGVGTYGSRSMAAGGSAVLAAAEAVRAKARRVAARLLEAAESDIEWAGPSLYVRGAPERAVLFRDVAATAYQPGGMPAGSEMGLEATVFYRMPNMVFPFGAYAAAVEVLPRTGEVKILQIAAVDDAGRIVNPLLAEGQVIGSIVQGVGQALAEEAVYDEEAQLLTSTLADYALLRASHVPPIVSEFRETPSPNTLHGAKGIGEAGTIGAPAAIANAVMHALRSLGIRHVDFPFKSEKMWRLISEGRTSARG